MSKSLSGTLLVMLMWFSLPSVLALESGWPRTVALEQGTVTIYQLQVDELSEDIIYFRAALAYRATADAEPVFGAGWFESPVAIDSSSTIVRPTDLRVTETRFPAGTYDVKSELSAVLAQQSDSWNLDLTVEELQAALKTAERESQALTLLNTAPPKIIYRDHPALLLSIDGDPVLREIENSTLQAVINTPYPLIFDGKNYYLNAAKKVWYRARQVGGPYQFETNTPAKIAAMVEPDETAVAEDPSSTTITAADAPEIVVSMEPAELIVTVGPAAFVPLVDDLLVLQNSDSDVFMHVNSQKFYIVLSGRWYSAGSLNGPWTFQSSDGLPGAFANIPLDSDQADSRVYVAGTEEAREAVLDAEVPQTAAVARGEVDIDVEYDGSPVYQPVDGTDLVYIQNTGSTVLLSDDLYYLVEDGVWYVSAAPDGPWQVSTRRPDQVDLILPTSPVHNVKYVHVYDSTPSVVYVGYTPGYTGSYVYYNTVFYGSGWYYPSWVSPYYYYPRQSSWGFNVSYNPWYGWNFGLSWGWGPFSIGYYPGGYWHHNHYWYNRHYSYWGPRGYRPRPVHYGHGYGRYASNGHGRNDQGRYGNDGGGRHDQGRSGNGDYRQNPLQRHDNLYRDPGQRASIADTRDNRRGRQGDRFAGAQDGRSTTPGEQRGGARPVNARPVNNAAVEPQVAGRNSNGRTKEQRSKARPVSPTIMREKADARDVQTAARQDKLLVYNKGKTYRGQSLEPSHNAAYSGSSRQKQTASPDQQVRQGSSPVDVNPSRQDKANATTTRARQKETGSGRTTSRQKQTSSADKQVRQQTARDDSNSARRSQAMVADTRPVQKSAQSKPAQAQLRVSNRSSQQRSIAASPAPAPRNMQPAPAAQNPSSGSSRQAASRGQQSAQGGRQSSHQNRSSESSSQSSSGRPRKD